MVDPQFPTNFPSKMHEPTECGSKNLLSGANGARFRAQRLEDPRK